MFVCLLGSLSEGRGGDDGVVVKDGVGGGGGSAVDDVNAVEEAGV